MTTLKQLNQAMQYGTLQKHEGKGHQVKVGFLTLTTEQYLGSSRWLLSDSKGGKFEFVPYQGLVKLN